MSTRSIIALAHGDGFKDGVYVHSDGYPTGRGPLLFEMLAVRDNDLSQLWADINSAKHNGWSFLTNAQDPPKYADVLGDRGEWVPGVGVRFTAEQAETDYRFEWHGGDLDTDAEWVYVFHLPSGTITVFRMSADGPQAVGMAWASKPQPDWGVIECGAQYERCGHCAWVHFPEAEGSRLSVGQWLGQEPLRVQDATGCVDARGLIWQFSGGGHLERKPGGGYGKRWFNSSRRLDAAGNVIATADLFVWSNVGDTQVANPDLTLTYPPTARDPKPDQPKPQPAERGS